MSFWPESNEPVAGQSGTIHVRGKRPLGKRLKSAIRDLPDKHQLGIYLRETHTTPA